MNRLNEIQNAINNRAGPLVSFLQRDTISILLTLTLVMYAGNFVPKVPKQLQPIFDYTPFKVGYLALVVYVTGIDAGMSILLGLAAYVTFIRMRGDNSIESFYNEKPDGIRW